MKNFASVIMMVIATVFLFSCSKDDSKDEDGNSGKPANFSLQGAWSSGSGTKMKVFTFGTTSKPSYGFVSSTKMETGTYSYNPSTDRLTLTLNMPGEIQEHYTLKWKIQWTAFELTRPAGENKYKDIVFALQK